jgi:hypothetical protein
VIAPIPCRLPGDEAYDCRQERSPAGGSPASPDRGASSQLRFEAMVASGGLTRSLAPALQGDFEYATGEQALVDRDQPVVRWNEG